MDTPLQKAPLVCSQRLTLAVLAFLGKFFVYSARVNLSVAILCMIRSDVTYNDTTIGQDNYTRNDIDQDIIKTSDNRGEFDWDKSTQSHLLSMHFYGYIFTQIPGGWLSSRFGGRRVWGFCQFVSGMCTLLTPASARTHIYIAYTVRFLLGFAAGMTFPAVHALLGRWAPPLERSKLVSVSFSGPPLGMIITLAISGILCEYGFDNGWGSIFYLCGIFNLMWVVAWFYMTADGPEEHKRISEREREYIQNSIGQGVIKKEERVPWIKMFKSGPVWAVIIAHFCNNYTGYTLLTTLPMFMKEAFKFDIKQNGVMSAIPYVTELLTAIFVGQMADKIIERGWLSVKNTRKLFQSICFLGPAVTFCVLVQLDSSRGYLAVALLCVCTSTKSACRGGYLSNHLDLAPRYAGIIFGITNTAATIPGIIAPVIAGALTPNKTLEEWRLVFYVCVPLLQFLVVFYTSSLLMESYKNAPLVCSQRLTLVIMQLLGAFFVYAARVNLSVAILCMVKSDVTLNVTAIGQDNGTDKELAQNTSVIGDRGEFDWDKSRQSHLLSMYFYGYIITQVPGGWLSSRFGGRRVWGLFQLVSAICTLLTPVSARTHFYLASAVRFVLGFSAGVTFPSVHTLLGRWAPQLERSKLVAISFLGLPMGMVITLSVSGLLCEYGFDNGWGSIFYLCGILNLIWVVGWFYLTADGPEKHKRISTLERNYIKNSIGKGVGKRTYRVPWVQIFKSRPVWAIIIAHFCTNYTSYTLMISLPMFMKEAFKFDIKQNGAMSSLPYLAQFVSSFFAGYMADRFIEGRWLQVKNTRKLFQAITLVGPSVIFCIMVQLDSSRRYLAVALLCMCTSVQSASRGAYLSNYLDLAPSYAGVILGITNTAGTIPGIIAPIIAGALTPTKTLEEWRIVFYVCVVIAVFGCLVFAIMADGELQPWAIVKAELENNVNMDKKCIKNDDRLDDLMNETENGSKNTTNLVTKNV